MRRIEANRKIVAKLSVLVEQFPDWRFQQLLQNAGISSRFGEDMWYEESEDTLKKFDAAMHVELPEV